jgi:hypothetical protein
MLKFGKTAASSRTHDGANDHLAGGGVLPCVGAVVIWIYIKTCLFFAFAFDFRTCSPSSC